MTRERDRLNEVPRAVRRGGTGGPYLTERAWGTVREDYSADGEAWDYFPHDHARSRAYRWNEDGLAGICDDRQTLCFALAFWNGRDPILKERIFGLTGPRGQPRRGRQGVLVVPRLDADALVDALALHVPAGRVPVRAARRRERARAAKLEPEFELLDTGIFDDDRYWEITVDYAKAAPEDMLRPGHASATPGPETATIDVLPTLWFRNTWSWGIDAPKPSIAARGRRARRRARRARHAAASSASGAPERALLRQRDERRAALRRAESRRRTRRTASTTTSSTAPRRSTREQTGTKAAFRYRLEVAAGRDARRSSCGSRDATGGLGDDFDAMHGARAQREADEFYAELTPGRRLGRRGARRCARRSPGCSGRSSSTTTTCSAGSTATRPARRRRRRGCSGRNHEWTHLNNIDVISMPDTWEYPWYAAWDLAFHCVALAHVDPEFAKEQLLLLLPRVVHAPERPAARLRVGVRRRQPAGARLGGAARLRDRRRRGRRLPRARLPQAAPQLHVVGEPQGRRGQQRLRGRLPRPRQHRPVRPLGAAGQRARSSSPTAPRGWRCTA